MLDPSSFREDNCCGDVCGCLRDVCAAQRQSIFSTGRRASQKLLELIRDIIKKTPMAETIVKCNQEELILQIGFDKRKIFSYP